MPDQGGGPVKYIAVHPCPEGSTPLALFVPATVLELASEDQQRKIALVQLAFAHRVSMLLSEAYADIAAIVRDEPRRVD